MNKKYFDFIICGGGASGLLLLKALREDSFFNDRTILLLDKEIKNNNDRTWCFWETKSGDLDHLVTKKWSKAQFFSANLSLDFNLDPFEYKMLRSAKIYNKVHSQFLNKEDKTIFIQASISNFQSNDNSTLVNTNKGVFESNRVFNSLLDPKPMLNQNKYPVLQQHFVGWFIKAREDVFDPKKILFMDFKIPQQKETRFLYLLPLDKKRALVEYTLFSKKLLEYNAYEEGIKSYLNEKGIYNYTIEEKEQGNIPMTCFPFEKYNTQTLLHIGTAGGWTKASTGFTFMNTLRNVTRLTLYLKKNMALDSFQIRNRFRFYDLLFLDVLSINNHRGSELFSRLFEKNPPIRIFRFLDEKTNFYEELQILISYTFKQKIWFLKALFRLIF